MPDSPSRDRTGENLDLRVQDGVLVVRLPDRPEDLVDEIVVIDAPAQ